MLAAGAVSVSCRDAGDTPILEPAVGTTPVWPRTVVTGLFVATADLDQVIAQLIEMPAFADATFSQGVLAEQNWELAWTNDYGPMCFGENLWVIPSHCEPPRPQAVNILLDPGLAFGSGTHPTTRLCLQWLAVHTPQRALVVDYGCGSGILGIAALKLGARHAWMVDNDPQALRATLANAERNGIRPGDLYPAAPEELPPLAADLLIANILARPLIELADTFAELVRPGGQLVLAGLLAGQADVVTAAYAPRFRFVAPVVGEEAWVLLSGQRYHGER